MSLRAPALTMNIDVAFVDKWITLELAAVLAQEPAVGPPDSPAKEQGFYALHFPEHDYVYFGEAGDLAFAKANHIYRLRCNRHDQPELQQAYNDDPQGKVLFYTIPTTTRETGRRLLEQFLNAYEGQLKLLNGGMK
jgi:hypothetical protein